MPGGAVPSAFCVSVPQAGKSTSLASLSSVSSHVYLCFLYLHLPLDKKPSRIKTSGHRAEEKA